MAKYYALDDDEALVKIVDQIADELELSTAVDFQVLVTDKGKDVVKVCKANQFTECITNREDLVFVVILEEAFNRVDDKTKYMWLRMEMDKISYDFEKGKVNIGCPCVTVPLGVAEKYGNEAIDAAKLALYTVSQIADEKKAAKEAKKKKKTEQAE